MAKAKATTSRKPGIGGLTNVIGDRGEKIFDLAITDYEQFKRPLFKPGFLGEKWPAVDFYVELLEVKNASPFFFVQVKSTKAPLPVEATVITITASKAKCEKLYRLPGPTYIVGVHEPSKRAFILSLHSQPASGVYHIPVRHELNPTNLLLLHKEVADFWKLSTSKPIGSHFV